MRKFYAVLLAAVVGMSVLVVAGSPVGAANTAQEALYDDDDDSKTDLVRQFAGANRYATALALARDFAETTSIDTVIIASGESIVDAAASAGLAGTQDAPVLLTTSGRLARDVREFIDTYFVSDVFIAGGTAAVSQAVEDDLNGLPTVNNVVRLDGPNRYATSADIAEGLGEPGEYCASGVPSALLVNVDNSFADVIALGPLAYALRLPILLTSASGLSQSVEDYLTENIEQVVIVGGTSAVPDAIVEQLEDEGISVDRISGDDRFATAIAIRDAMVECVTIGVSASTVALVNGNAAADGVSAGPALGTGLANDQLVTPVLLVTNTELPGPTRDYLAGLPVRNADSTFVDLDIYAIGGTSVVPDSVVSAAIEAAVTSDPLTAEIDAKPNTPTITIEFSSAVNSNNTPTDAAYTSSAYNPSNYRVGPTRLLSSDTIELSGSTVTVTLADSTSLSEGVTIAVPANSISALGADRRRVEAASFVVPRAVEDRTRPAARLLVPANGHEIRIVVTEENLDTTVADLMADNFLLNNIERRLASGSEAMLGDEVVTGTPTLAQIKDGSTDTDITICLFGDDDLTDDTSPATDEAAEVDDCQADASVAGTGYSLITANERFELAAEVFEDDAGNESRSVSERVLANRVPEVTRATVTKAEVRDTTPDAPGGEELATWAWLGYAADNTNTPDDDDSFVDLTRNYLTVTGKADGIAAGAAGNGWYLDWYEITPEDDDTIPNVMVEINNSRRTVRIGFDEEATVFTVASTLVAHEEFGEIFSVSSDALGSTDEATAIGDTDMVLRASTNPGDMPCETAADLTNAPTGSDTLNCGRPTRTRRALEGGVSTVTVTLTYNSIIEAFDYNTAADAGPPIIVASGLVEANKSEETPPTGFPAALATTTDGATDTAGWQEVADVNQTLDDTFQFTLTSSLANLGDLPKANDTINLPAGLAETYATTTNASESAPTLRLRAG